MNKFYKSPLYKIYIVVFAIFGIYLLGYVFGKFLYYILH